MSGIFPKSESAPLAAFMAELAREFPNFRIVPKDESPLSRAIDVALKILTLGGQRHYMTHYHTVIGDTLYVPAGWTGTDDVDCVITLRHERIHLRQRRRYTLPGMAFLYFIPFFPLGLAYGRARIEWEAYTETLRATAELKGMDAAHSPALRRRIVQQFTGPAYGGCGHFDRSSSAGSTRRCAISRSESPQRGSRGVFHPLFLGSSPTWRGISTPSFWATRPREGVCNPSFWAARPRGGVCNPLFLGSSPS